MTQYPTSADPADDTAPAARSLALGMTLVWLTGLSSLIYEVAWIRRASLAFGSSSIAFSTVLAVFFVGLGAGSGWFGQRAARARQPLVWCAAIELALSLYGIATPALFAIAEDGFGFLYRHFGEGAGVLLTLRAALVGIVLLPPTLLMGGTLPLFCRAWVRRRQEIAGDIGRIYGINTVGATFGAALSGFVLLPKLGMTASVWTAAAINALCAFGFWRQALGTRPSSERPEPAENAPSAPDSVAKSLTIPALAFFLVGATALANEVLWARFLGHFLRNSVYTYSLSLCVVLAGTALGSLWASPRFDRMADRGALLRRFAMLQAFSAIATLILSHLPAGLWQSLRPYGLAPFVILMLPSAVISGASFPLINRIATADPNRVPSTLGWLNAVNIAGCVAGSLVTGYGLLPVLGLDAGFQIAGGLALTAATLAGIESLRGKTGQTAGLHWPAIAVAAGALASLPWWSPVRIPRDYLDTQAELVDFEEGYNSSLAVTRENGTKTLLIDRLWQGVDQRNYQIMVAHLPMFHFPEAKDVLLVGLGAGTTASRFLLYDIGRLDIVDIEPRLFDFTARHFPSEWRKDARVRLIAEDGRNYVKHSGSQYDLMSVEIGQPDRPGVALFYTREFYLEARERLREGGMISQFVPLRFLRLREFSGIVKTFLGVFPDAQLWYNTNELLLMGFKGEPRKLSQEAFRRIREDRRIRDDINVYYWNPAYPMTRMSTALAGFLATGKELRSLAQLSQGPEYNDDTLELSYSLTDYKRDDLRAVDLVPHIHQHLSPVAEALADIDREPGLINAATTLRDYNVADMAASDILDLIDAAAQPAAARDAIEKANQALQWNPQNIYAQQKLRAAETMLAQPNPLR
jgi:spermidine synthase